MKSKKISIDIYILLISSREAQQAETSFTEFAALNESSTDDVSFIEKVIASSEPNESDRMYAVLFD